MTTRNFVNRQQLIEQVIKQIADDLDHNEPEALEVLLLKVPESDLIAFLPEEL